MKNDKKRLPSAETEHNPAAGAQTICRLALASALLFTAGCGSADNSGRPSDSGNEVVEASVREEDTEVENASETRSDVSVIWTHKPDLQLEGIQDMITDNLGLSINNSWFEEFTGYPQEWDYLDSEPYASNAIILYTDDRFLIADYSGNTLFDPVDEIGPSGLPNKSVTYRSDTGWTYADLTKTTDYEGTVVDYELRCFSKDFRTTEAAELPGGVGGYIGNFLSNQDGKLVFAGFDTVEPVDEETMRNIRESSGSYRSLIQMIDSSGKVIGYSLYDENWSHLHDFPGAYIQEYYLTRFVNGFCVFGDHETVINSDEEVKKSTKLALYNMETGEPVTEFIYSDAKWFEDGYCPVKKDDRWGFIDESGNEVTDFIFDEVSSVYQGKAYVGRDGLYGILDLKTTLENNIPITYETCFRAEEPVALEADSTASGTADSIGHITVKVDKLNIRRTPATDGEKAGQANTGDEYPVYETSAGEGYTWYRISENQWIADKDQEWAEFTEN